MSDSPRAVRLRPRFGMGLTVVVAVLGAIGLGSLVVAGEPLDVLTRGWGILLLVYGVWMLYWAPSVTVGEEAVVVDNPGRRIEVPWGAIERIDTAWALRLHTRERRVTAWAAPAPSRYATTGFSRSELRGFPESTFGPGRTVALGDLPRSDSGLAAFHVRRRWEELRDAGRLGPAAAPRVRWHAARLAVLGALVVATVASLTLP